MSLGSQLPDALPSMLTNDAIFRLSLMVMALKASQRSVTRACEALLLFTTQYSFLLMLLMPLRLPELSGAASW